MIKRQFVADKRSESQLPDEDEDPLPHERTGAGGSFYDIASYLSGIPQQAIKNSIKPSERSLAFLRNHYPDATLADWADWRWQIGHSINKNDPITPRRRNSDQDQNRRNALQPLPAG